MAIRKILNGGVYLFGRYSINNSPTINGLGKITSYMNQQASLTIKPLSADETPIDLLLLADPCKKKISEYIGSSEILGGYIGQDLVGIIVIVGISHDTMEVKNIAVQPTSQGMGYGKEMLLKAVEIAKERNLKRIKIGTGNTSIGQLTFYQNMGFEIQRVVKDFFTNNYPEPIYENGNQCTDMVELEMELAESTSTQPG
ncbi:MAG: GNAT family N-acetyltransferase [Cyclobacteriaceae bacterium]